MREIDRLILGLGSCTDDSYCQFHERKSTNISLRLAPVERGGDDEFHIIPDSKLVYAVRSLDSDVQVAGSWNLVAEERVWLDKRLRDCIITPAAPPNIVILGVAGATHFFDTLGLILGALEHIPHNITVIERCPKPLSDIRDSLLQLGYNYDTDSRRYSYCARRNICVQLIHGDVCDSDLWLHETYDIVLSHYLFRFLTADQAKLLLSNIYSGLSQSGRFIVAQDPTSYSAGGVDFLFRHGGFEVLNSEPSWGIFSLTLQERHSILDLYSVRRKFHERLLFMKRHHAGLE
jgi:hypothetical protein